MHVLFRETHSLDETAAAVDLAQTPADLVLLSFSDTDLGAAATAWEQARETLPSLRLANLASLRHPLSVDLYVDRVVAHARCVVVRLLGGLDYWKYGAEELAAAARKHSVALAFVAGDNRVDARLAELSTVSHDTLQRLEALLQAGGPANALRALRLAAAAAGRGADDHALPEAISGAGTFALPLLDVPGAPFAAIIFYRAHLVAGDIAPILSLAAALAERGLNIRALYASSLKDPGDAAFLSTALRAMRPAVVLNATGFAARLDDRPSPLEAADAPILQLVLASSPRAAWDASTRGLAPSDMAMQIVLPELDGRLSTPVLSFKTEQPRTAGLEFARIVHQPDPDGVRAVAALAAGWTRLARTAAADRKVAIILSDYPGAAGNVAHAVGLDALESAGEVLGLIGAPPAHLAIPLTAGTPTRLLDVATYRSLLATIPLAARRTLEDAWGSPEHDPDVRDGWFQMRVVRAGNALVAVQPDRGISADRKASYHDPNSPPRHAYVAFYLWLREVERIHALVHMGTHGTTEWLPGKAMALSSACWPQVLTAGTPVVYPFIVNNPGEAAAAKRRLGAVTIGHLTPPLRSAGSHGAAVELERMIDEFAEADGMDRRRTQLLRAEILARAGAVGLLEESGAATETAEDAQLARLNAYLCDVKELQIRDGLHVFGRAPQGERRTAMIEALGAASSSTSASELGERLDASARAERDGLLAALRGRFVPPGPAGAPTRGRADVLPTGRNLFAADPRAIPTRSAVTLAQRAAEEVLRRHRQDYGDWPRAIVIDLWGSATLRTGGEDFALALELMGVRPTWDNGSNRVTGFEVLPLVTLNRPRVDVTLRISGLFRDAFESQVALFDAAVRAVAARDEPSDNLLAHLARGLEGEALRRATARVFGAAPGSYGTGVEDGLARDSGAESGALGAAFLDGSSYAYGLGLAGERAREAFRDRVRGADAFVHTQDHREIDLLDAVDFAAHEGGFAAAARSLGGDPALYHTDTTQPDRPVARTVAEEVKRVVRGRAANPVWVRGMMRHGYRGGAEIARGLDGLYAFAVTLPHRFDGQFEQVFDATIGDDEVDRFLRAANPAARAAMAERFRQAMARDLWRPRRNSTATALDQP